MSIPKNAHLKISQKTQGWCNLVVLVISYNVLQHYVQDVVVSVALAFFGVTQFFHMCVEMINAHYYFKTHLVASDELTSLVRKGTEGALNYTWNKYKKKGRLNDYYLEEYIKSVRAQSVDLTYNDSIK